MMHAFRILLLFVFPNRIVADLSVNTCSIRSSDYSVIDNADFLPTNTLLILEQLTVISREMCGFECLANTLCLTATFKVNIGQCVLYFDQMKITQTIPFSGGYVLSINGKIPGLSKLIPLISPSNSIFSIWNSGVGRSSSSSSQGFSYGQYPPSQSAIVAIDGLRTTTYVNYGNTMQYVTIPPGGIGSGFYVITNLGVPSILSQFRIATGSDVPIRDPFIVSIEGSNGGDLTQGSSWTFIYNGSTGLESDPGRGNFGPFRSVFSTKSFSYYRLLTVLTRNITDCVQYSEVEFYGYLVDLC